MFKNIDKTFKISISLVCWALLIILIIYLLNYFYDLVAIIAISIAIAYILLWPVKKIEEHMPEKTKNKRFLAASSTYIIAIIAITLVITLMIQPVSRQFIELGKTLPEDLRELELKSIKYLNQISAQYDIKSIQEFLTAEENKQEGEEAKLPAKIKEQTQAAALEQKFVGEIEKVAKYGAPALPEIILGTFRNIIYMIIIGMLSFYFIMGERQFYNWFKSYFLRTHLEKFTVIEQKIDVAISAYVRGQAIIGLLTGTIMWLIYESFGLKYSLILAIIMGIAQFVPVIGHTLAISAALIVALAHDPMSAIVILILFLILMTFTNNILVPVLLGDMTGLNPVFVILALVIGERVAGVLGVFLAVPVALIIKILIINLFPQLANPGGTNNNPVEPFEDQNPAVS